MFSDSLALLVLLVVHFGFAGLLGALASRVQTIIEGLILALLSLIYLMATFTLPLPIWATLIVLICALFLAALAAARVPRPLFQPRIGWFYAATTMLLILMWSAVQDWQYPWISLGAAAGLAATLAWKRGLGSGGIGLVG